VEDLRGDFGQNIRRIKADTNLAVEWFRVLCWSQRWNPLPTCLVSRKDIEAHRFVRRSLTMRHILRISFASLLLTLSACGSGDQGSADGQVSLSITDAPIDGATSVVVQFSGVAFKREGAAAEIVENLAPSPRQLDLLQYQEGRAALLLDGVILPAGKYEWIRLIVDNESSVRDSYLVQATGEECELRVPSGAESGLKLNRGFTLPADGSIALTIDFDLRKSVHAPPGQNGEAPDCSQGYLLRPTLRIVDDANVGAIVGMVDSSLVTEDCLPKVYVFSGNNVLPRDIDGDSSSVGPEVVAGVAIENGSIAYDYHAAFLTPGAYTVAFTCGDDDPALADSLSFLVPQNVTVQANLISTADFAALAPQE
jgi:hypothetical protein